MRKLRCYIVLIMLLALKSLQGQTFQVDTIMYNGNTSKHINFVVLSEGFQSSELNTFITKCHELKDYLFNVTPFKEYSDYFNVFAIRVPSAESGADHPKNASDEGINTQPAATVNTYFNATFDYGSIHRLLVPTNNTAINNVLLNNFPQYDQKLILVNSPYYGGSGGSNATGSLDAAAFEIMAHELGHSFAGLADEYYAGDGYAAERPNMTQQTNPSLVKWKNWMGENGIGIYQHSGTANAASWYRPHNNCKMRSLGLDFCSVCKETLVEAIHQLFGSPITAYSPMAPTLGYCSDDLKFKITAVTPEPNTLKITWKLNNVTKAQQVDSLVVTASMLAPGNNSLVAEVRDTTGLSRSNSHALSHVYTQSWTIQFDPSEPVISSSQPLEFCEGDSTILSTPAAASYAWSNDATTQSIVVKTAGNYSVTITDGASCTKSSDPVTVVVKPNPIPLVDASAIDFCPGDSVKLTSSPAAAYAWNTGETDQVIYIKTPGAYTVTDTKSNGCSATSLPVVISQFTVVSPSLTPEGQVSLCEGDSVELISSEAASYLWSSGQTTQSIIVSIEGDYNVTTTDANNCKASSPVTQVVVHTNPEVLLAFVGTNPMCDGDSLLVLANPLDNCVWGHGAAGGKVTLREPGYYWVEHTDDNGCKDTTGFDLIVLPAPEAVIVPASSLSFCLGDSVVLEATGGATYTWSNGDIGPELTVFDPGTYNVLVTGENGCQDSAEAVTVTVWETPVPTITATGDLEFCEGDSVVLTCTDAETYTWNTGAATSSIIVKETGTFYVVVADPHGCEAVSESISAQSKPRPVKPIIVMDGSYLRASSPGMLEYGWYFNGMPWPACNSDSCFCEQPGDYLVSIMDINGCSNVSDIYTADCALGVSDQRASRSLSIYPNPGKGTFRIQSPVVLQHISRISIYNLLGELIFMDILNHPADQFDIHLNHLTSDIYFLHVESGQQTCSGRLLIDR